MISNVKKTSRKLRSKTITKSKRDNSKRMTKTKGIKDMKIENDSKGVNIQNFEYTGNYANIGGKERHGESHFVIKYYQVNNDVKLFVDEALKKFNFKPNRLSEILIKNSGCKVNNTGNKCLSYSSHMLFEKHDDYPLMFKRKIYKIISFFSFYDIPEGNELEMLIYHKTSNTKKYGLFRTLEIKDKIPVKSNNFYIIPQGIKYKINIVNGKPDSRLKYVFGTIQIK
jgi:hypothetical protein